MKATQTLYEHGQSLWLDNINRGMLDSGQIQHYIDRYAVTERTDGVDGWVSLEVSPLLAYATAATIEAAKALYAWAARRNLSIKIPGTAESLPASTWPGSPRRCRSMEPSRSWRPGTI